MYFTTMRGKKNQERQKRNGMQERGGIIQDRERKHRRIEEEDPRISAVTSCQCDLRDKLGLESPRHPLLHLCHLRQNASMRLIQIFIQIGMSGYWWSSFTPHQIPLQGLAQVPVSPTKVLFSNLFLRARGSPWWAQNTNKAALSCWLYSC